MSCPAGEHRMLPVRQYEGQAVECQKCHIGWILSPGTTLRDGHVYIRGKLLL